MKKIPTKKIPTGQNPAVVYKVKKQKFSRRILDHSIQGILIFASVFLAFWLSELKENQKNRKIVENALQNIAAEMQYNHEQVVRTVNYQYSLLSALDSIQKANPKINPGAMIWEVVPHKWFGPRIPMLRSSAYQTLINSGIIKDVPLDTANQLALIYNFQTVTERMDNVFIEQIGQNPDFLSIRNVNFFFGGYMDLLPELMAWYQVKGKVNLARYGYDLELDQGILKNQVEIHANNIY